MPVQSETAAADAAAGAGTARSESPRRPRRDAAARLFGYDVFISFALGPPPRGSQSYASDLARQLRERDFTVFYSEDEAAPGEQLDSTLRRALLGSRALVVVANRGTLGAPRWVRQEVEIFRAERPDRPIVPISIDGALLDPDLAPSTARWMPFQDRIWLDETQAAADTGLASPAVVERLALVPGRGRSNVKWRWLVRSVGTALLALAIGLGIAWKAAHDNDRRARAELLRSTALRAASEAQAMVAGLRPGGHERALQQLAAAHGLRSEPAEVASATLSTLLETLRERRLLDTGSPIRAVALRPGAGSAEVVSAGAAGRVQRWDAVTLQPLGPPLTGPASEVLAVAYSPDGRRIAAGDLDGQLWIWDTDRGAVLARGAAIAGDGAIRALLYSPDGRRILTGGVGRPLRVHDAASGRALGTVTDEPSEVNSALALSPDGRTLAAADVGTLWLWSWGGGRWVGRALGEEAALERIGATEALAFDGTGQWLAAGSRGLQGWVTVWEVATGRPVGQPVQVTGSVGSLQFLPQPVDGGPAAAPALLVGARGLETWDVASGLRLETWMHAQYGNLHGLALSADGRWGVSGGSDGLLRVWQAQPERPSLAQPLPQPAPEAAGPSCAATPAAPGGPAGAGRGLAWSPDCSRVLRGLRGPPSPGDGGPTGALQWFDARTGQAQGEAVAGHRLREVADRNAKEPQVAIVSAAVAPDGRRAVSGSQNGSLQRWTLDPLRTLGAPLPGHDGAVSAVAVSPDGRTLASGGVDGQLRWWDADSGTAIGPPLRTGQAVRALRFSADGQWLLSADAEGRLQRWPAPPRWLALLCGKLAREMARADWPRWITPELAYVSGCEAQPSKAVAAAR